MRTLCLSMDFDAILFWRDDQSQDKADQHALPLSDGLRQRLDEFYRWFSELHLLADGPRSQLDNRLFDDRGIELWEQLRSELQGQYRVIYYSQELAEYFDTPELFRAARKGTYA
jgi:hypothetical protein